MTLIKIKDIPSRKKSVRTIQENKEVMIELRWVAFWKLIENHV